MPGITRMNLAAVNVYGWGISQNCDKRHLTDFVSFCNILVSIMSYSAKYPE